MNILVTGAKGQLGKRLLAVLPRDYRVTGVDIDEMDITDPAAVTATFADAAPDLVLHCAALTAVDHCAEHPQLALRVNGLGTRTVAIACQQTGAALLYISSNEVFSSRRFRPFHEYDTPAPGNPYAYSKWIGEQAVRELVPRHMIVRTSWLFSHGGRNFIQAILGRAREGKPLRVVVNEVSAPTYNHDLVDAIIQLIAGGHYGTFHLVNDGSTSRYGFAREALNLAGLGDVPIEPISLNEYPRASRPPEYAVLHNSVARHLGITLRSWQAALADFLARDADHRNAQT